MTGGIYLLQHDDQLIEMREQAYDTEDLLQDLLARYPNLLAGDQINRVEPRRWILVTREMAVPAETGGADRWTVDHLFLDQDAIPTIVEVKRSSDTRIRREVIGQLLEYATNAVVNWPIEKIIAQFEATCTAQQRDPLQVLADLIGSDTSYEHFWQILRQISRQDGSAS